MKQILTLLLLTAVSIGSMAQAPHLLHYTAILRDSADAKVTDQSVALRLSIVTDTAAGQVVFQESHTASTDAAGLVSLQVGSGMAVSGSLDSVRWDTVAHYLRTEVDLNGGTDYKVTGYTRLLSVPYAYHTTLAGVVDTVGYANDIELRVSPKCDILFFGTSGQFLFIPGISPFPDDYVSCDIDLVISTVTSDSTGKVWMDRNLGASRVATAIGDTLAYGDLYQWGRFADGHQCRGSDTISTHATTAVSADTNAWYGKFILPSNGNWLSTLNDTLWQGVDGTNNPCPSGFRLPTEAEWEAERVSWSTYDMEGAFASPLKLPAAGYRFNGDGSVYFDGTGGSYWSSSVSGGTSDRARYMGFLIGSAGIYNDKRANGFSVRCIKD